MYRPFPNAERALRQIDRHDYETSPLSAPRPMTPLEQQMLAFVRGAAESLRRTQPSLALAAACLNPAFNARS